MQKKTPAAEKKLLAQAKKRKAAVAKAKRRQPAKPVLTSLVPGDAIRLSPAVHNQFTGYDPLRLPEEVPNRAIEGIVLSIREIKTGKLLSHAEKDFGQYVVEILHNRSFDPAFSSSQGGRVVPGERGKLSPLWEKVRAALRQLTKERHLVSMSDGSISKSPLAALMDGWRIVKIRADRLEAAD